MIFLLIAVFPTFLLLLLLLLLLFQQGQVLGGIDTIRLQGEGFLVGGDGLINLTCFGQRIAAVVPLIARVAFGELLCRGLILFTAIGRCAGPFAVFKKLGCRFVVTDFQCPLSLLIRCQPQVVPDLGMGSFWRSDEKQG